MIAIESRAKINWYLRVLDRRPDGFHNIETVFQEIGLCDRLIFEKAERDECRIMGFPADVPAQTNLITKAWELMRREFPAGVGGIQVEARKEIPRGGGLGGGSSNAAAALNALNALFDLKLPAQRREELGAMLGSDVPFFIQGGCAAGRGRGELLTPVRHHLKAKLILLFPGVQVSTGDAYHTLATLCRNPPEGGMDRALRALAQGDADALSRVIYNDFEHAVAGRQWFTEAMGLLKDAGCHRAFLCGSGSTVAGLVSGGVQMDKVLEYLHKTCAFPIKGCDIG